MTENSPRKIVSVALIGAPQTNKTEVATIFAEKAKEEFGEFRVLDNFPELVEELGLAVGIYGDYRVTNLIHYLQWAAELNALKDEANYITVGTAYERLAHGALLIEILQRGVQTPETGARVMPEVHATTALSLWIMNTFSYRYGFYIPRAQGLEIVGVTDDDAGERQYADKLDQAIQVAFERFRQSLQRLTGSPEDMADEMLETIVGIETQIANDEHPTLNPDGTYRQEFLDEARAKFEEEVTAAEKAAEDRPMTEEEIEAAAEELPPRRLIKPEE